MKDESKNPQNQPKANATEATATTRKTKTVAMPKTSEKTELEKLREELAYLKSQLVEKPMSLEEKIKFFQAKQDNILKLSKLDGYADLLIKIGEEAQEESEADEFFSEKFSVKVAKKPNKYDRDWTDILTIQNPVLVSEMLDYALQRINTKRDALKNLIEA